MLRQYESRIQKAFWNTEDNLIPLTLAELPDPPNYSPVFEIIQTQWPAGYILSSRAPKD
jgi:hypothetical protein